MERAIRVQNGDLNPPKTASLWKTCVCILHPTRRSWASPRLDSAARLDRGRLDHYPDYPDTRPPRHGTVAAVCTWRRCAPPLGCDEMTPRKHTHCPLQPTRTPPSVLSGAGVMEAEPVKEGRRRCRKLPTIQTIGHQFRLCQSYYPANRSTALVKRSRSYTTEEEAAAAADEFHVWVENGMPTGEAATAAAKRAREAAVVAAIAERLSDDHDAAAPFNDVVPSVGTLSASPPAKRRDGGGSGGGGGGGGGGRAPPKANIQLSQLCTYSALAAESSAATVAAPTAAAVPTPAARGPSNEARGRTAAANAEPRTREMATGGAGSAAAKRGREPRVSVPDAAARLASGAAASTSSGDVAPSVGTLSSSASPPAKRRDFGRSVAAAAAAAAAAVRHRRRRSGSASSSPTPRSPPRLTRQPWRSRLKRREGPIRSRMRRAGG